MKHINYIYDNPLSRLIDTALLREKLDELYQERERWRRDRYLRRHFSGAIKSLTQRLKAGVKSNYYIRTKWEMLLDPFRRMQVLIELGGEAALLSWEARRERYLVARRKRREQDRRPGQRPNMATRSMLRCPSKAAKPPRRRTDRSGIFYLAPAVEPAINDRPIVKSYDASSSTQRGKHMPRIALTPDELRGDVLIGLGIGRDGRALSASPVQDPVARQTHEVISSAIRAAEGQLNNDGRNNSACPVNTEPGEAEFTLQDGRYVKGPD